MGKLKLFYNPTKWDPVFDEPCPLQDLAALLAVQAYPFCNITSYSYFRGNLPSRTAENIFAAANVAANVGPQHDSV